MKDDALATTPAAGGEALEAAAKALTGKQRVFTERYVETLNATDAALFAYEPGNDNAAAVQGHRTLRNAKVQAYLAQLADAFAMQAAEIIMRLSRLASTTAADFISFDDEGPYIDLEKAAARNVLGSVRAIKQTTRTVQGGDDSPEVIERTLDVKFQDPRHSLKALAKIMELTGETGAAGTSASEQTLMLVEQKIEQHVHAS